MKINTRYFALFGLALFVYIIYRVGISDIFAILSQINKPLILLAFLLVPFVVTVKSIKWWFVMKAHGVKYSFLRTIKVWLIGSFVGTVTPARAGEFIKVFYVNEKASTGKALSTVFVDRVLDMFALFILTFIGLVTLFIQFGKFYIHIPIAIGIGIVVLIGLTNKKFVGLFFKPLVRFIIPKSKHKYFRGNFDDFYLALKIIGRKKKSLAALLGLSLLIWLVSMTHGYILVISLGLDVPYLFFLSIAPIITLITVLPISVIGLGTRDASAIYFFSLLGISAANGVAYSLLDVTVILWTQALLGLIVWLTDKKEIEV